MVDPHLQQRFARRCADAAFGYSAAGTAAYAAFADQVLNFWTAVLQPPRRDAEVWSWPVPAPRSPVPAFPAMPLAQMAFGPFAWATAPPAPAPVLPTNPWEAMTAFTTARTKAMSGASMGASMMSAPVGNPLGNPMLGPMLGPMANPMTAWLAMFPFSSPPSAWPMAFMLMSSGVPHSVAWPTAEANAAVMDAADAATQSIKQVFASYRTDGGHSSSAQAWPQADMLTLAALVPLNISTMLAALRMA